MALVSSKRAIETASSSPNKRIQLEVNESSNFDRLPDEMVEAILDLVHTSNPTKNFCDSTRLVCRRWNKLIAPKLKHRGELRDATIHSFVQLTSIIKLKCLVLSGLSSNRIRTCRRRIRESQDKGEDALPWTTPNALGGRDYHPRLFKRSVEHLVVGGEAGIFLGSHDQEEKELPYSLSTGFAENYGKLEDVLFSIKGPDLVNILSQLEDIKTLTLSTVAFLSVSPKDIMKINFSQHFCTLSTLDLCVGAKTDPTKLALVFENHTFPTMSSFYVRVHPLFFHFSLFVNLYKFMSKHPQLKNLSLSQAQAVYGVPKDNCEYPALELSTYPELKENLMKIKLNCLRIDCLVIGHEIGQQWKNLETAFIQNQTNLRGLEIQLSLRNQDFSLDKMLPPCGATLERLELSTYNVVPNHFDCTTISTFSKLTDCHLYLRNYYNTDNDESREIRVTNVDRLPSSIQSLHLGRLPSLLELRGLTERLTELRRISYSCDGDDVGNFHLTPFVFINLLLEHLRFPRLVEYRMYQYSCPTVAEFLHKQKGLVCYIEDEDSVVVLVDKEEFDIQVFSERVFSMINCSCKCCSVE